MKKCTEKEELKNLSRENKEFAPQMENSVRENCIRGWKKAVKCALFFAQEETV